MLCLSFKAETEPRETDYCWEGKGRRRTTGLWKSDIIYEAKWWRNAYYKGEVRQIVRKMEEGVKILVVGGRRELQELRPVV